MWQIVESTRSNINNEIAKYLAKLHLLVSQKWGYRLTFQQRTTIGDKNLTNDFVLRLIINVMFDKEIRIDDWRGREIWREKKWTDLSLFAVRTWLCDCSENMFVILTETQAEEWSEIVKRR